MKQSMKQLDIKRNFASTKQFCRLDIVFYSGHGQENDVCLYFTAFKCLYGRTAVRRQVSGEYCADISCYEPAQHRAFALNKSINQ